MVKLFAHQVGIPLRGKKENDMLLGVFQCSSIKTEKCFDLQRHFYCTVKVAVSSPDYPAFLLFITNAFLIFIKCYFDHSAPWSKLIMVSYGETMSTLFKILDKFYQSYLSPIFMSLFSIIIFITFILLPFPWSTPTRRGLRTKYSNTHAPTPTHTFHILYSGPATITYTFPLFCSLLMCFSPSQILNLLSVFL